jgi:hypothetical protein
MFRSMALLRSASSEPMGLLGAPTSAMIKIRLPGGLDAGSGQPLIGRVLQQRPGQQAAP